MLLKNYYFRKKSLPVINRVSLAYENLTTDLGTILQKSYEVSKIGPQVTRPVKAQAQNAL